MTLVDGKSSVITGAASGIGEETAKLYAENGANVVVADIDVQGGKETVARIEEAGGTATFVETNVANPRDVELMIQTAVDEYGGLDVLFNNAGIEGPVSEITEYPTDDVADIIDINLKGVWFGIKYGVEAMRNDGGGAIISTSSIGGIVGVPQYSIYGATKAGVSLITKTAALEYADDGIRANAVAPGIVETDMVTRVIEEDPSQEEEFRAMEPMPGLAQPEEIASAVLFLGSPLSSRVTGTTLPVEGGVLSQ